MAGAQTAQRATLTITVELPEEYARLAEKSPITAERYPEFQRYALAMVVGSLELEDGGPLSASRPATVAETGEQTGENTITLTVPVPVPDDTDVETARSESPVSSWSSNFSFEAGRRGRGSWAMLRDRPARHARQHHRGR